MLRRLWPFSVVKPDYPRRSTLVLVTVFMQFGRWKVNLGLKNGAVTLTDSNCFAKRKTYRLTRRAQVTLLRYYVRPAPTTESSERA